MGNLSGGVVVTPVRSTPDAAPSRESSRATSPVHRPRRDRLPLLLLVLALAFYVPGFTWGIPSFGAEDRMHSWGNDDLVPLGPLAEMYNTFVQEEPDRNVAYPWFHYALVAGTYAPYLGIVAATGGFSEPSSGYPFGLGDPEGVFRTLTLIGRGVTLALALALVLGMYYAGRQLWDRPAGFMAAVFTMLMYPMVYYSRLGNLDVPVLAWTGLGLAACAACLRHGVTPRRAAALAVFIALAGATKDQSAGSFVFVIPALLWIHFRSAARSNAGPAGVWRPLLAGVAAFVPAYLIASGALVDPGRFSRHLGLVFSAGTGTVDLYNRHPATLAGYAEHAVQLLRFLTEVLGWPVLLLSVVGIVLAIRSDRRSLVLLLASIGFMAILLPVRFGRIHYLLPVALPLTLFAGYAAAHGLRQRSAVRAATAATVLLGAGLLGLQAIDLDHAMMRDSRYAAADWFEANARPGDRVLHFGASMLLPPLSADVETIGVHFRADARPALLSRAADFVIVLPDDTNEERRRVDWREGRHSVHSDYMRAEDFDALADGSFGYRLVAKYQTRRLMPWLPRPFLSYSTVNPPIQIFARDDRAGGIPRLEPWWTAPHYPRPRSSYEPMPVPAPAPMSP